MRQCIALAGVLCLAFSGCVQTGLMAGKGGQPTHVARSMSAPRPDSGRASGFSSFNGVSQANYQDSVALASCDSCDAGYCDMGECCDDACCGGYGCDSGNCCDSGGSVSDRCSRLNGRANALANGIASGFCPHRGGYPECGPWAGGPPSAQTAYPYYTTRGPRDFFSNGQPNIGPY